MAAADAFNLALPTHSKDGAAVGSNVLDDDPRVIAAHQQAVNLKDMCV